MLLPRGYPRPNDKIAEWMRRLALRPTALPCEAPAGDLDCHLTHAFERPATPSDITNHTFRIVGESGSNVDNAF